MVLDILVENAGRVNYGAPLEVRKGEFGHFWSIFIIYSLSVVMVISPRYQW